MIQSSWQEKAEILLDDKRATLHPRTFTTICSLETGSFASRHAGLNCARAHAKQKAPGTIVNSRQLPRLVWSSRIHHNLSCRCFVFSCTFNRICNFTAPPRLQPYRTCSFVRLFGAHPVMSWQNLTEYRERHRGPSPKNGCFLNTRNMEEWDVWMSVST